MFQDEGNELPGIAARVLGREVKKIAARNRALHERIANILEANTKDMGESRMAIIMAEVFGGTIADSFAFLTDIHKGYAERFPLL